MAILAQYKLCDLYSIILDDKKFNEHVETLNKYADAYRNTSIALMELEKEICKGQKFDLLNAMAQVYDNMSEKDQREFCGKMLNKKNFFTAAYEIMMGIFRNGVKTPKK